MWHRPYVAASPTSRSRSSGARKGASKTANEPRRKLAGVGTGERAATFTHVRSCPYVAAPVPHMGQHHPQRAYPCDYVPPPPCAIPRKNAGTALVAGDARATTLACDHMWHRADRQFGPGQYDCGAEQKGEYQSMELQR